MLFVFRQLEKDAPMSLVLQGDCEEFIKNYFKWNIHGADAKHYKVMKAEELDINQFLEIPLGK